MTDAWGAAAEYKYVLEEEKAQGILSVLPVRRDAGAAVALLVGPEGGWTDRERESSAEAGWRAVSLGPRILKTETAALAALAILNAAWEEQWHE